MRLHATPTVLICGMLMCWAICSQAAILKGPYLQDVEQDRITVCWQTDEPGQGLLEYGLDGNLGTELFSDPEVFEHPDIPTTYLYRVPIYGLLSSTVYYYRVTSGGEQTPLYSFVTEGDNQTPYTFVVIGDSRNYPNLNHRAVVEAVNNVMPAFFFNTGDLVSSGEVLEDWDHFFEIEKPLMANCTLYPVYGNHEDGLDEELWISGLDNWGRFFALPGPGSTGAYYSFDYGNVHFLVINVEDVVSLLAPGSPQREFINADLQAAVEDTRTNFIMAFFHEPPFSWKEDRNGNFVAGAILEPIFEAYGVDIVWTGHDHFYARRYMNGIDHVVTGGGGAPLYDFQDNVESQPGYRAHSKCYHYCKVDVNREMLSVTVVQVPGETVIDTFEVYASEPPLPDDDDDAADDDTGDDDADDDAGDDDAGDDDAGDEGDEDEQDDPLNSCGCRLLSV